jgi:hypothetical protein
MAGMGHWHGGHRLWGTCIFSCLQVPARFSKRKGIKPRHRIKDNLRRKQMTPFSFEWQWNIEYILFFGLLYIALGIIGIGLTVAAIKTALQLLGFMMERHS